MNDSSCVGTMESSSSLSSSLSAAALSAAAAAALSPPQHPQSPPTTVVTESPCENNNNNNNDDMYHTSTTSSSSSLLLSPSRVSFQQEPSLLLSLPPSWYSRRHHLSVTAILRIPLVLMGLCWLLLLRNIPSLNIDHHPSHCVVQVQAFSHTASTATTSIYRRRLAWTIPVVGTALHPTSSSSSSSSRTKTGVSTTTAAVTPRRTSTTATHDSTGSSSYYNNDPMNNRHSASDWLYNVRSLPESKVLREIRNPVISVFVWSLFVSFIYTTFQQSSIRMLNTIASHMCIPGTAHSFLVSALGLLLVFRTNSAYQRFNEGRKIWENILSVSRNLSRFLTLYDHEIGYEKQRRMMNLVAAYPYLLRQHIRPGCLCSNRSQDIPSEYRLLLKEQRRTQHETRHEGPPQSVSRSSRTTSSSSSSSTSSSRFYEKHATKNSKRITNKENNDDDDDDDSDMVSTTTSGIRNNNDDSMTLFGKKLQLTNTPPIPVQPTNTDVDCWVDRRALPWSLFIPQSLPAIATAENRPLWVCDRMAALICKIPYGPNFTSRERLVLLGMVDKLTNAIGQCERIHQTAVPLNYARHSLRSLTLWLFTLPFALVQDLGFLTAFANAVIAWLFFGVYQIGYSIEDPFQGSLRLSILCDAIRRSVIRQPSTTYPDEDPNSPTAAYSPEECLNLYASSKDGSIPEECLLYSNIPSLTDVIRRSVKSEESMSLSIEETMILQQKEKLLLQQQLSSKIAPPDQSQGRNDTSSSTTSLNETKVPSTSTLSATTTTTTSATSMPGSDSSSTTKTIWSLDEEMLATPKIVTYKNGTWTEIGI